MESKDKGLTIQMGADSSAQNTQMPQNLSAQAQQFGISMKKGFIGRP
jgi:hypothetical protein